MRDCLAAYGRIRSLWSTMAVSKTSCWNLSWVRGWCEACQMCFLASIPQLRSLEIPCLRALMTMPL